MSVMHRTLLAVAVAVALTPIACLGAGYVGAVAVQGDYAYVGINRSIVVVDVSDPHHPTPVGQTSYWPDNRKWFVEDVSAISVVGDHAYVVYNLVGYSGRSHSMVIVDVSRPTAPKVTASYDVSGWSSGHALGVTASGQYAYLYHTTGLDVVDISNPVEPTRVGRWGSHSSSDFPAGHHGPYVASAGGHVYVADREGGLRVIDVSDPAAPKEVGSCESVYAVGVAVVANRAFLGGCDLKIIDISDPTDPKEIGSYDREKVFEGSGITGVAASGNYVFLYYGYPRTELALNGLGGLLILDVSDPSAPKKVSPDLGPPFVDGPVMALALREDYAYIGVGPRLVVVDVSDPKHLSVLGSTEVLPCKLTDIAVAGDHAFLASGRGGLRVLDFSDPGSPKEVGSFRPPGAIATVTVVGKHAFAGEQDVLHVLDISDPSTLREVAPYRIERPAPKAAGDEDDEDVELLIVAGDADELEELEEFEEEFVFEFRPRAPEVAIVHDYACLAVDGKTLKIIDISDPAAPKEMGSYEEEVGPKRVAACGDYVLMLYEFGGSLNVVDLSPLAWTTRMPYLKALALAASVGLGLLMFWVSRSLNQRLLQAEESAEFLAKVSQLRRRRKALTPCLLFLVLIVVALPPMLLTLVPNAPRVVGRYAPPGFAEGLAVAGRHAYIVGERQDGRGSMLWVLDVSNPASARKIGSCKLSQWGRASDVAVAGKYAYVVDNSHALHVVNVTNPAAPKVIGSYSASIHSPDPQAVAVAGQHVLVTDGHWGMRVFDVTDPASPKPVCFYDSPLGP